MNKTIPFFVLLLLSATFGAPLSWADRIFFANGDVTTGILVSAGEGGVVFEGNLTGSLAYQWSDITKIEISSRVVVRRKLGANASNAAVTMLENPVIEVAGEKLQIEVDPNATQTGATSLQIAELVSLDSPIPEAASPVSHWQGAIKSQDSVTRATQDQYQLGATLHASYETERQEAWEHQKVDLTAQANFSESSKPGASPVRTALYEGIAQYDLFTVGSDLASNFPPRYNSTYLLVISDWYHNLSLGMNLEQAYGVGYGWSRTLRGKPDSQGRILLQTFGVSGDVRYIREKLYPPGGILDLAATDLSEHYSISIPWVTVKPLSLSERIQVIPAFNNSQALQVRGIAEFLLPLTKRLSIGPQLIDDYLRNAPPKTKQNYLQPQLSFTYLLGPLPKT
jgi:hypothetical protein